jgi:DNA-3-methyladenine glycosylase
MHDCLNIVAEPEGRPGCVLIRALEPVEGIDIMRARRPGIRTVRDLASGPGRLTKALAITRGHNGADVTRGALTIHRPKGARRFEIDVTARIGITKCADWPLRFIIHGNPYVSR